MPCWQETKRGEFSLTEKCAPTNTLNVLFRYLREDRDLQEKMAEQGIRYNLTKQSNFRANKY